MLDALLRWTPRTLKDRLKRRFSIPDMEWSLRRLKKSGFRPRRAVDAGAYEGEWTELWKRVFPECEALMLEVQEAKRPKLAAVARRFGPSVDFAIALVAAQPCESLEYYENETVTSVLPEHAASGARRKTGAATTLDAILAERGWPGADFLKLDLQGFELEALKGAPRTLSTAEAVLMEVSLIDLNKGAPLLPEVVRFMEQRRFLPHDVCSLIRRPLDDALWQLDMIFVRCDSPLLQSKRWG